MKKIIALSFVTLLSCSQSYAANLTTVGPGGGAQGGFRLRSQFRL
jgi:hypothetical protein